jgi:hypothetical protein
MCKLNSGTRAFAVVLLCATAVLASSTLTFTTLHSFVYFTDGANPLRDAGPSHRWELLRDNDQRRGQRSWRWDGLQNHP